MPFSQSQRRQPRWRWRRARKIQPGLHGHCGAWVQILGRLHRSAQDCRSETELDVGIGRWPRKSPPRPVQRKAAVVEEGHRSAQRSIVLITWLTTREEDWAMSKCARSDPRCGCRPPDRDRPWAHRTAAGRLLDIGAGGVLDHGAGEADPLLHAAAEFAGQLLPDARQPDGLPARDPPDRRISRLAQPAVAVEQKADVLPTVSEASRAGF